MKIVVDTSVWIAAVLSNRGASHEILNRALAGEFEIVVSHSIYQELTAVLERPEIKKLAKFKNDELKIIKRFLKNLRVGVKSKIKISRDPNDDMFIQCAVEYGVDFILSHDKDLLDIKKVHHVNIISPGHFLKILRGPL